MSLFCLVEEFIRAGIRGVLEKRLFLLTKSLWQIFFF